MQDYSIGFIGAGNMAGSLIQGLLNKGHRPENLIAADIDSAKLSALCQSTGIRSAGNAELVRSADVVVLAVKPQAMKAVCRELDSPQRQPLFVSIAAGITLSQLERWLGSEAPLVRCMPNTPALVGKGATALFANARVDAQQKQIAQELMASVGLGVWVDEESDLDLVTAVSGSGPAYFFLFMEAMQEAARQLGMEEELARALVLQTATGAAELAVKEDVDLAELRRRVTSPGGTTEKAVNSFESDGLRDLVKAALTAARDRSVELAAESGDD